MPNCFQLTPVNGTEPAKLQEVDNRLWREVGKVEPDPKKWFRGWYNTIGLKLALGKSFEEIRKDFWSYGRKSTDEEERDYYADMMEVSDFLQDNYTANAWYQPR